MSQVNFAFAFKGTRTKECSANMSQFLKQRVRFPRINFLPSRVYPPLFGITTSSDFSLPAPEGKTLDPRSKLFNPITVKAQFWPFRVQQDYPKVL